MSLNTIPNQVSALGSFLNWQKMLKVEDMYGVKTSRKVCEQT